MSTNTTSTSPAAPAQPAVAPYEYCIAFHVIGVLVLQGMIDPHDDVHFETGCRTGLPYAMQVVSEALLAGVRAYGWQGSIRELINAADRGTPAGWKSADLAESDES